MCAWPHARIRSNINITYTATATTTTTTTAQTHATCACVVAKVIRTQDSTEQHVTAVLTQDSRVERGRAGPQGPGTSASGDAVRGVLIYSTREPRNSVSDTTGCQTTAYSCTSDGYTAYTLHCSGHCSQKHQTNWTARASCGTKAVG